jgi:hypothetical protein
MTTKLTTILSQLKSAGVSADNLIIATKHAITNYELLETIEQSFGVDHSTAIKLAVAHSLCEGANYPIEPYWVDPSLPALDFGAWVAANWQKLDHEFYGAYLLGSLRLLFEQAPMLLPPQQKPKRLLPRN